MRVLINDECHSLLTTNKDLIKDEYLTYSLFVDSAIRAKLRRMGVDAGNDAIIAHLKKQEVGRLRHLDKAGVKVTIKRHEIRMATARKALDTLDV